MILARLSSHRNMKQPPILHRDPVTNEVIAWDFSLMENWYRMSIRNGQPAGVYPLTSSPVRQ